MQFIYRPEGTERRWPFEPGKMLSPEATEIEKRTGMRFSTWRDEVVKGSMVALHGLLFVLLKRENPTLKWDQVVFAQDECDFEMEDEEIAAMVRRMEGAAARGELDDDQLLALGALKDGLAERGYVAPATSDEDAPGDPTEEPTAADPTEAEPEDQSPPGSS